MLEALALENGPTSQRVYFGGKCTVLDVRCGACTLGVPIRSILMPEHQSPAHWSSGSKYGERALKLKALPTL